MPAPHKGPGVSSALLRHAGQESTKLRAIRPSLCLDLARWLFTCTDVGTKAQRRNRHISLAGKSCAETWGFHLQL